MEKFHYLFHQEITKNVRFDLRQLNEDGVSDLSVLFRLYYSLEFAIGQVLADGDERYYPNASFSILSFMKRLRWIRNLCGANSRFLDVGCGLGNKIWIAQELGFDAFGIEINPKYAEIAQGFLGTDRILIQDAMAFQDYAKYDVIYFYNPMPSDELETAIFNCAKKDAIIYHAIQLQSKPARKYVRLSKYVVRVLEAGGEAAPFNKVSSTLPSQLTARSG